MMVDFFNALVNALITHNDNNTNGAKE